MIVFVFKQKTAYEMRISDWSSDVCSSDLDRPEVRVKGWSGRRCTASISSRMRAVVRPVSGVRSVLVWAGLGTGGDSGRLGLTLPSRNRLTRQAAFRPDRKSVV